MISFQAFSTNYQISCFVRANSHVLTGFILHKPLLHIFGIIIGVLFLLYLSFPCVFLSAYFLSFLFISDCHFLSFISASLKYPYVSLYTCIPVYLCILVSLYIAVSLRIPISFYPPISLYPVNKPKRISTL